MIAQKSYLPLNNSLVINIYSKTNVQLFNQLHREGYQKEDIKLIFDSYQLAQQLFPFYYRPSGDTFISHLVGTASILVSLHMPIELVSAGLLHATYIHGDFGTAGIKTISESKRKKIRDTAGDKIEEYIFKYTYLKWNSQTIPIILNHLNTESESDCNVLLMRLANELEDNLNLTPLYCPDAEKRIMYIKQSGPLMIKMGEHLGFPYLASKMKEVFEEIISSEISDELRNINSPIHAHSIAPKSFRKRLFPVVYHPIYSGLHFINKLLNR